MTSFNVQEYVLCYHGPLIYEAKILKIETWDESNTRNGKTGQHFWVHYKGWKQTWDEWVAADRVLKINDANIAKKDQLNAAAKPAGSEKKSHHAARDRDKDTSSTLSGRRKEGGAGGTTGRKRGREEDETRKPEMKLDVPDVLKVVLVDDWEAVTKNNQLVILPREPCVEDILKEFSAHCEKSNVKLPTLSAKETVLQTTISGFGLYFERSIGSNLLYRFERGQYAEVRRKWITGQHVTPENTKTMSQVYGAEHLLRMLVNLPAMIAQTSLDAESISILKDYVVELMQWMVANKTRLFLTEYENATSHYLALMRS